MTPRRGATTLALVALAGLLAGGVVWARGTDATIKACVEPRTNYLKLGGSCGGQELTWNTAGPAGPQGPAGPAGPAGPKGDPAPRAGHASKAEVAARASGLKKLRLVGKPNLAEVSKVTSKLQVATGGVFALSAFHDEPVVIPSMLNLLSDPSKPWDTVVAHLDVPAGKYVVIAKARALNTNGENYTYDETAGVLCYLVAGADSDAGNATHWNMLALEVVHVFTKPGRIQLNCTRATAATVMELEAIKLTAIRVQALANAHVEAG
jgi:hypothetical protein